MSDSFSLPNWLFFDNFSFSVLWLASPQPKIAAGHSTYTNAIITLIWADGDLNRSRPVMFTSDPRFRSTDISTPRRAAIFRHFQQCLHEYSLSPDQVVFLKHAGKYVPESRKLVRRYLKKVQVPENSLIFSDGGQAWRRKGKPIIPKYTPARTTAYPSMVHQYLSPNDNSLHGAAKAKWRAMGAEKGWSVKDAVASDLYLLSVLTHADPVATRSYFTRNLFLSGEPVTLARCSALANFRYRKNQSKERFFARCARERSQFEKFGPPQKRSKSLEFTEQTLGGLDGSYWMKIKSQ